MADDVALTSTPDTTGGNPIDVTTVVTAAGTVKRQRVSLGAADLDRDVTVTAEGALLVDPGGATQPISAASLPLPTGASTEATLALIKAKTDNLDVALSTRTKPADTQTVSGTVSVGNLPAVQPVSDNGGSLTVDGSVSVSNLPATQPVSAASLPLPAGASTEATLAAIKAKTDNLDVALSTRTKPADTQTVAGSVSVTNFPGTQPVSATSLPLPAGAATEATLALVKAKTDNLVASAKGAQAATGLGVQDLKDAGRTYVVFTYDRIAGITSEALATMTINKGGTTTSATTYTVTAGKTLRLQSLYVEVLTAVAASNRSLVRVRSAASVTASSPIVAMGSAYAPSAGTGVASGSGAVQLPDGLEIAGGQQVAMSHLENVTTAGISSACLTAYEY